jgi:uncharacterized protein YodC (DUF2158 family)
MQEFKLGDVVCLKSSPEVRMTVEVYGLRDIGCVWFDTSNIVQRSWFPAEALTKSAMSFRC